MISENSLRSCYTLMHDVHLGTDQENKQRLRREYLHAVDVLRWIKVLSSTPPSFELQVAGLLHDSDRWINMNERLGFEGDRSSSEYKKYKKLHAQQSAIVADQKLTERNVPFESKTRIKFLIEHHDDIGEEVKGINDPELNLLVAADSFSYFTSIAPEMLAREGEERVKIKVRFMIEKMPLSLRQLLFDQKIDNPIIQKIKQEVLNEFGLF